MLRISRRISCNYCTSLWWNAPINTFKGPYYESIHEPSRNILQVNSENTTGVPSRNLQEFLLGVLLQFLMSIFQKFQKVLIPQGFIMEIFQEFHSSFRDFYMSSLWESPINSLVFFRNPSKFLPRIFKKFLLKILQEFFLGLSQEFKKRFLELIPGIIPRIKSQKNLKTNYCWNH